MVGGSYNGSTAVSKTACVGSIPTPPATDGEVFIVTLWLAKSLACLSASGGGLIPCLPADRPHPLPSITI